MRTVLLLCLSATLCSCHRAPDQFAGKIQAVMLARSQARAKAMIDKGPGYSYPGYAEYLKAISPMVSACPADFQNAWAAYVKAANEDVTQHREVLLTGLVDAAGNQPIKSIGELTLEKGDGRLAEPWDKVREVALSHGATYDEPTLEDLRRIKQEHGWR